MPNRLPPEDHLGPTQAVDPKPRMEKPTRYDVPTPQFDDADAEPVYDTGEEIVIES